MLKSVRYFIHSIFLPGDFPPRFLCPAPIGVVSLQAPCTAVMLGLLFAVVWC